MSRRCATSGKAKLLLPALLLLASLSGCGRTVTTAAASSCGTVIEPTALPTQPPDTVVTGPGHVESIVTSGENAYVGSDNGSIYAFSAARCTPLWQRHLASQGAAVYAVSDGVVYVSDTNEQAPVYALSAASGKVLWQSSLPGASGFRVLVQDGVVFADGESAGHQHTLTALRASDGRVLWQDAPSPPLELPGLLGTGTGVVYIRQAVGNFPGLSEGLTSSTLLALDAGSGRVLWTATLVPSDGAAASSPVETRGVLCVLTSRGAVYGLQASTGIQLWHIAGPGQQIPVNGSPYGIVAPVGANGLVYATEVEGVTAYRVTDGSVAWHYQTWYQGPFPSVPVLVSGVIYFSTGGPGDQGAVIAMRESDGTVLWKRQDADTPDFGPLLVDAGLLINNGNTGPTYALKMSDGSQAWRSPYMPEGSWYTSFGAPEALGIGAGGSSVLYIGSEDGVVHALRVSDGRQLWQYVVS